MRSIYDVIIVGAGIVGAACAMECARHGMSVAIVEDDVVGGGATAAGMGHIVVMDDSPAQLALTWYSQQLWNELSPQLPQDVEYEATGTIWIATDVSEMEEIFRKQAFYEAHGIPVQVLDQQALRDAEPNLHRDLVGGLLVSSDAVLYPPCAARYFLVEAEKGGAVTYRKRAVAMGQGSVKLSDGTTLISSRLVNAMGAMATDLTPGLNIRKRKGHLVITDRAPGFVRHQLVEVGYLRSAGSSSGNSVAFNVQPRNTGQILIGSSRQYDAEGKQVDPPVLLQMMQRVQQYLPDVKDLPVIRTWTGFRAATPDKLPLIGPHPDDATLFLATGHEGLGITTSLATAKLLAYSFTGSAGVLSPEPYLPSRLFLETQNA
jgi:D-hydroxyproline dehydrogenase subunit beta